MTAKLIKHSASSVNGKEILTFELTYPRIVHSELLTHRIWSRNAASSRAIPIDKLIKLVETDCAMPAEWGLNQAGMQAKGTHLSPRLCKATWLRGAARAVETARELQELGLHKQVCNRPLEAYQFIKYGLLISIMLIAIVMVSYYFFAAALYVIFSTIVKLFIFVKWQTLVLWGFPILVIIGYINSYRKKYK